MCTNHLGRHARKLGQIKCTQLMSESLKVLGLIVSKHRHFVVVKSLDTF